MTYPKILTLTAITLLTSTFATAEEDVKRGEALATMCHACHRVDDSNRNKIGPNLYGAIHETTAGSAKGYRYSPAFLEAAEIIGTWDDEELMEFLAGPSEYLSKILGRTVQSKMVYQVQNKQDRKDIIAYLKTIQ